MVHRLVHPPPPRLPIQRQKGGGRSRPALFRWIGAGWPGYYGQAALRQIDRNNGAGTPHHRILVHSPPCLRTRLDRHGHRARGAIKTVLYGTAYGDSISTVHSSASSILKRRETHVS